MEKKCTEMLKMIPKTKTCIKIIKNNVEIKKAVLNSLYRII